jgi:hypothetical protein
MPQTPWDEGGRNKESCGGIKGQDETRQMIKTGNMWIKNKTQYKGKSYL